jgi:hypothetical protein
MGICGEPVGNNYRQSRALYTLNIKLNTYKPDWDGRGV